MLIMNNFSNNIIEEKLSSVFGFSSFRPGQKEIVEAVLSGRDLFAVMPTGGGKSLCYQLPAVLLSGTTVVVSPLISLMKDQVDGAKANGIAAAYLNSTLTENEKRDILEKLQNNKLDLLYIAPERFGQSGFLNMLLKCNISLFAIDEAHCISEWGHDFRPDYLMLSELVSAFEKSPVIAFTASATKRVQNDIIEKLKLRNPYLHRASFDRPNLFIEVKPKSDFNNALIDFVNKRPQENGIVYRTTRKAVEQTAEILKSAGINALPYHAGLEDNIRHDYQEQFNNDKIDVIVATIAFGMGIDKSNVRYVVHGDLPKNIEGYYQEIGRAGRDGEPANCTLFYSRGDISKQRYFIDQVEDDIERQRLLASLNKISSYAGLNICRRKQILEYFNEEYSEDNCGNCDVCTGITEKTDVTVEAQKLLSTVIRTGNRFGAGYVIEVLLGAQTQKIKERGHDSLTCYGIGNDRDRSFWLSLIDNLIALGYLIKTEDKYPVLQCGQSSRPVLKGEDKVYIVIHEQRETKRSRKQKSAGGGTVNPDLFQLLRSLRLQFAEEQKVPPFVIFSDATLREMSDLIPKSSNDLLSINGVGEKKLEKYGEKFLREIDKWHTENPNAKKAELKTIVLPKKKVAPGETFRVTLDMFNEGKSIEEIAKERELSESTIEGHLAKLIEEGEEIDHNRILSPDKKELVYDLANSLKTERLKEIVEAADGKVSYGEVRIALALIKRDSSIKS